MTPDELVGKLFDVVVRFHPMDELVFGLAECDDRLPDLSKEAQAEEVSILRELANEVALVDESGADEIERQSIDLVRSSAAVKAEAAAVPLVEFSVSDFQGSPVAWVLAMLPKAPLVTRAHADAYLARLEALPAFLETAESRHRDGVVAGRLPVRRLVQAAIDQLDVFLSDHDVGGLRRPAEHDASFATRVGAVLDDKVRPALARYRQVLASELLDAGRDDEHCGLSWLPAGEEMYAALARLYTSVERTPEELHRTGLELAEQINEEYRELGGRVWGTTDLPAILERLRSDPELRYEDGDEILADARAALARAEEAVPRWFGTVPDTPCLVARMPVGEEVAPSALPAYYMPPALDRSLRGTYFVNTSRASERSRADTESAAFHEAVPGHHFQLAIMQERSPSLARRVLVDTACVEGWALYAERLADEMGLYRDDLGRLGMLTADMWRAGRLVVDTGIHLMSWTRQRAVDWYCANVPLPRVTVEAEVNRHLTCPATAFAYMVGRLELVRLRREAAGRLASRFDLSAFHDVVLGAGPLPLAAMAGVVDRWTARLGAPRA